ncbi:GtrA family protein [Rhodococcus sp. D2-41]|nr:GtrA family protein [Rhodococcus sp. D2-41]
MAGFQRGANQGGHAVPRRLSRSGAVGQFVRFCLIGVVSAAAYLVLYLALRRAVGAQVANFLALLLTAIANTAANRAFTFGVRGRRHAAKHQLEGLVVFGLGLALTSGSLLALHVLTPTASQQVEVVVLFAANSVATLVRFLGLRWVFVARHGEHDSGAD